MQVSQFDEYHQTKLMIINIQKLNFGDNPVGAATSMEYLTSSIHYLFLD
jgi:hypothetical protein